MCFLICMDALGMLPSNSGQCHENSSVKSLQTSQSPEKPVSSQSIPPVRRASSLASPELMMHVDTREPSVWSHTLQVPQHRLEIHFWERLCPAAPYSAPFSLNLALQAIKSPTGNGISSKRPRGFHYHYSSNQIFGQTAWWNRHSLPLQKNQLFLLSENGLLLSKQIGRHCLVSVQCRLQPGSLLQWDAGFIWSFLGIIRGVGRIWIKKKLRNHSFNFLL